MDRREFVRISATAATLASGGLLPTLAADGPRRPRKARKTKKRAARVGTSPNPFTEPAAIEPITGYVGRFAPIPTGSMAGDFTATYSLVKFLSAAAKSRNQVAGSLELALKGDTLTATETRHGNVVKTVLDCRDEDRAALSWSLASTFEHAPDAGFTETGAWDGKAMTVKSAAWTQERATSLPLMGRWALLPLLASGKCKRQPLRFDMLDDSTLRPDQTLKYSGTIEIPTKTGPATLDCYAQTGRAIVPTHYLVDAGGCVQLITQETVNWALAELR